jgi:hypothetical protein
MKSNAEFSPNNVTDTTVDSGVNTSTDRSEEPNGGLILSRDTENVRELVNAINLEIKRQTLRVWIGVGVACFLTPTILLVLTETPAFYMIGNEVRFCCFIPIFLACLLALPSRRLKAATAALTQCDSIEAIGPILEYTEHILPPATTRALEILRTRLLFRVKASDAHLFSARHQKALRLLLISFLMGTRRETDRTKSNWFTKLDDYLMTKRQEVNPLRYEAVLKALEQVGDDKALPLVRKIAELDARAPDQEQMKSLAQDCLPALEDRLDRERPGNTLLRPAGMEGVENLLRAVQPGASIDTSQLLRSVNDQE